MTAPGRAAGPHVTQAVVLVGGEGRRLRPLTDTRPKPMMPLVDRPIVEHQLDHLRRYGVHDVVFSCGYRPDALRGHFGDGSGIGMRIAYVQDPAPLGTGGAIRNAEPELRGGDVLVLNGDILTDLDVDEVLAGHRAAGAAGTVVLTEVANPSAFGLVRLGPGGRVRAFLEKPGPDELRPDEPFLVNAGTYILGDEARALIPDGVACSIEREVFPVLAARGALHGHPSDAYWRDVGTPVSYLQAHADALAGRLRTIPGRPRATYTGPGCRIAPGAAVGPLAALGPGVEVGDGAAVAWSVVGEGCRIGAGAVVEGAILGAGVRVGEGARVLDGMVVGDRAVVPAGALLMGPGTVPTGPPAAGRAAGR